MTKTTNKYREYRDKNGTLIEMGMTIQHDDGDIDYVYSGSPNDDGEYELGVNASNENHKDFNELEREIYPLWQFDLSEWKVLDADNE